MRPPVNPVVRYLVNLWQSLAADWNAFWHTPADPTLLGVIRLLTGAMLLYTHAVWGLALDDFFGPSSWLSPGLVRSIEAGQSVFSFWFWMPASGMWAAHAASMVILALFTIGLWTRLTGALAVFVAISYANRVPSALFGLDQINVMLTLYLTIGPSGSALSIDRLLALRRKGKNALPPQKSAAANLAQRLIQVHMSVIYLFAGISKLQGPSWWTGEAMWRAFANLEYQSLDMTWLAWHPWLVNAMTHVTILWELTFCFLIWRPRWRPLMLAGAVLLHLGIGACLAMWTFGLIMLVGCAAFLPNEEVRRLVGYLSIRAARSRAGEAHPPAPVQRAAHRPGRATAPLSARTLDDAGRRRI
jgi:hypothetical protein